MTRIVDVSLKVESRTDDEVKLLLVADVGFTGTDLTRGQSGASKFEMRCILWDDDSLSDDRVTSATHLIEPSQIRDSTRVEIRFTQSLDHLRSKEPFYEKTIELFGEFALRRDGEKIGPSRKTHTVDVDISKPSTSHPSDPPHPTHPQHIDVTTEGAGASTVFVTHGSKFTPNVLAVVRITDKNLHMDQAAETTGADGTFTSRRQVSCSSGAQFTVTAFEDHDPTGTIANAVVKTCP